MEREPVILAHDLRKRYGDIDAVRGVSFEVGAGESFGFLGPNGAGKSTTISMLCTLILPSGGTASVAGFDVAREPAEVRRRIGLVFQETTLDLQLTVLQNLRFHAELYGLPRRAVDDEARRVLEMVGLWERRASKVRALSGGMKRRLEIARGLLHSPRVLFLDEPTIGLDPQTRQHIWDYIGELRQRESITIFSTTHYMDEAEYCDRIAIIDGGRIVAIDTPEALKAGVGTDRVELSTADDDRARVELRQRFGLEPSPGDVVTVHVDQGEAFVPRLFADLDVPIEWVRVARPTLDDVFMAFTGRSVRDAESAPG